MSNNISYDNAVQAIHHIGEIVIDSPGNVLVRFDGNEGAYTSITVGGQQLPREAVDAINDALIEYQRRLTAAMMGSVRGGHGG